MSLLQKTDDLPISRSLLQKTDDLPISRLRRLHAEKVVLLPLRPVYFALPKMNKPRDAVNASAAIVEAVADGDLTPSEAAELTKVIDGYARSLQAVEFEERLSKLEKAVAK